MNAYTKLQKALTEDVPVIAQVILYNGEHRIRVGPVANLTHTHVTFYDVGKGFRTAPMQLVGQVKLNYAEKARFKPVFDMPKEAQR